MPPTNRRHIAAAQHPRQETPYRTPHTARRRAPAGRSSPWPAVRQPRRHACLSGSTGKARPLPRARLPRRRCEVPSCPTGNLRLTVRDGDSPIDSWTSARTVPDRVTWRCGAPIAIGRGSAAKSAAVGELHQPRTSCRTPRPHTQTRFRDHGVPRRPGRRKREANMGGTKVWCPAT